MSTNPYRRTSCKRTSLGAHSEVRFREVFTDRSFAWVGHMAQNLLWRSPWMVGNCLCWMTNGAVGHRKTTEFIHEWLTSLYFLCSAVPFSLQLGRFCTMRPSHASPIRGLNHPCDVRTWQVSQLSHFALRRVFCWVWCLCVAAATTLVSAYKRCLLMPG